MFKNDYRCTATDFVAHQPTLLDYLPRIETGFFDKIKECFDLISNIDSSIREDFHKLKKETKENMIRRNKYFSLKTFAGFSVMAYPTSDVNEVLEIMDLLNLNSIPVAKNPWNKKLIGYFEKEKIKEALEKKLHF